MPRYTHQACNIEELIQISPYAVICLFRFTLSLLMGLLQWTPYVSTKVLLGVCVYIAGLTVLEKKPTQSKIARTLGNVSHDALNRLAKPVNELYQQIVVGIISAWTKLNLYCSPQCFGHESVPSGVFVVW